MPKKKLIHRGATVLALGAKIEELVQAEIAAGRWLPLDRYYDFSKGRVTRDLGANAAEVTFPCGLKITTRAFTDYFIPEESLHDDTSPRDATRD